MLTGILYERLLFAIPARRLIWLRAMLTGTLSDMLLFAHCFLLCLRAMLTSILSELLLFVIPAWLPDLLASYAYRHSF